MIENNKQLIHRIYVSSTLLKDMKPFVEQHSAGEISDMELIREFNTMQNKRFTSNFNTLKEC